MKLTDSMAYATPEEMMFGFAQRPVTTRRGLVIGAGSVIAEVVPHPRPGSEKTPHTLKREFERANDAALEHCINIGTPELVLENERVYQMNVSIALGHQREYQACLIKKMISSTCVSTNMPISQAFYLRHMVFEAT